jgi:hypothetical protein
MIVPISRVIQELRYIPKATWTGSDPAKPPIIRPRHPPEISSVGLDPVFDDEGYALPSSPLWEEAVTSVGRNIAPGPSGRGHGGHTGIDALAWYSSFHSCREGWGIYVPFSSLLITDHLYLSELPMPRQERWRLAWKVLIAHEIVHFAVDYAVAWFELLYHAPIKRAFADRIASDLGREVLPVPSSYLEIEETLANGNVLRAVVAHTDPESADAVRRFMRQQPPGYRDGELAESNEDFAATTTETLRNYLAVWSSGWNIDPGNAALDLSRLLPLREGSCPIWILNDLADVGLPKDAVKQITCVHPIEETGPFKKKLVRLHDNHQRAWVRLKDTLATGIPNGSDFKKWSPERVWSVRVNDNFRAHLQQPPAGQTGQPWRALDIDSHKNMRHG